MTRTQLSAIAIAFGVMLSAPVFAADNGPATRAQVKAELAEAIRTGNMVFDETGQLYNEFFPHNYPAQQTSSKTREEVRAELAEAVRTGNIVFDETGQLYNEFYAHNYADQTVASKTREEVQMELAEAMRNDEYEGDTSA